MPSEMRVIIPRTRNDVALTTATDHQNAPDKLSAPSRIETGKLPWQVLELYFKIVACHASTLSHLLRQRALKKEYFAWQMRCLSRVCLSVFCIIQIKGRKAGLHEEAREDICSSATDSLKKCITNFRAINSFCRAVRYQPRMDKIARSRVDFGDDSPEFEAETGDRALFSIIDDAETCILNAIKLVEEAIGRYATIGVTIPRHVYVINSDRCNGAVLTIISAIGSSPKQSNMPRLLPSIWKRIKRSMETLNSKIFLG